MTRTRDGHRFILATPVTLPGPSPWMAKLRRLLSIPEVEEKALEVTVLDGESMEVQHRVQIPVRRSLTTMLQVSADGQHLVYTDGRVVEHWPLGWRLSLPSVLIGGGVTLALVGFVALWRVWRGRRRDTMTPDSFAPPSGSAGVSHAQT